MGVYLVADEAITPNHNQKKTDMKNNGYFISTGDRTGFYTLKQLVFETTYTMNDYGQHMPSGVTEKEMYFQNLSTDREEAIRKAREITGFDLEIGFDLYEITKRNAEQMEAARAAEALRISSTDWSVMTFGKHQGRKLSDLLTEDRSYLDFVSKMDSGDGQHHAKVAQEILAPSRAVEALATDAKRTKVINALGLLWLQQWEQLDSHGFCYDVSKQILSGANLPSDRAIDILVEVKAKGFGRRGSKKYQAALEAIELQLA